MCEACDFAAACCLIPLCPMENFVCEKQKEILVVQLVGDLTVFRHVVEHGTARPIREGKLWAILIVR